ncbi:MAG: DVUA0089 family protein, partial [Betaproteobacteria bacterium]
MTHPTLKRAAAALALALAGFGAHAADATFAGQLVFDTDVVRIDFTLASAGNVAFWTDSWQAGLNFDPTLSMFDATGHLIATGDDTADPAALHAGQGGYDSDIEQALAAGHYILTLSASGNDPLGATLADGFSLDGTAPILISEWNQPSYDINKNDQKGGFWELRLTGICRGANPFRNEVYARVFGPA